MRPKDRFPKKKNFFSLQMFLRTTEIQDVIIKKTGFKFLSSKISQICKNIQNSCNTTLMLTISSTFIRFH